MANTTFCPDCGFKVEADWKVCANCNHLLRPHATPCSRCFQLIDVENPVFCPYCSAELGGKMVKKAIVVETEQEVFRPIVTDKYDRSTLMAVLRFDIEAMKKVSGNTSYLSQFSTVLLLLVGLGTATSYYFLSAIFGSFGSPLSDVTTFIQFSLIIPVSLYIIAFFINQINNLIGQESTTKDWKNLITAVFPIFLIKDILVVLIGIYVYVFSGSDDIAMISFTILLVVAYTLVFFEVLIYFKNWANINGFVSFLLVAFTYYFAAIISVFYLSMIINKIVEAIIWLV